MSSHATRRAVADVLAHRLRGDSVAAVGVDLGQHLQSALTNDIGEGGSPSELLLAIRDACGQTPVAHARILELVVLASLDEVQVPVDSPDNDLRRGSDEPLPSAPPRRSARRRR